MINIHDNEYFDIFLFNSGIPHLKWNTMLTYATRNDGKWHLFARINTNNDLMSLLIVVDALRRIDDAPFIVTIPFIEGRQDRVANIGDPFSLKIYADIINSCRFEKVRTIDNHSDVLPALINNIEILPTKYILKRLVQEHGYDTIIIPDSGASKKCHNYYFPDDIGLNFIQYLETRDTKTGKLSNFRIVDEIPDGANCLLSDDVIDGGFTAYKLGELIKTTTKCNKLGGYFTHGIFSKGSEYLYEYFDELYTTNSWKSNYCDHKLNVIPLF